MVERIIHIPSNFLHKFVRYLKPHYLELSLSLTFFPLSLTLLSHNLELFQFSEFRIKKTLNFSEDREVRLILIFLLCLKNILCHSMSKSFLKIYIFQTSYVLLWLKHACFKSNLKNGRISPNYRKLLLLFCCRQWNLLIQWFEKISNYLSLVIWLF